MFPVSNECKKWKKYLKMELQNCYYEMFGSQDLSLNDKTMLTLKRRDDFFISLHYYYNRPHI